MPSRKPSSWPGTGRPTWPTSALTCTGPTPWSGWRPPPRPGCPPRPGFPTRPVDEARRGPAFRRGRGRGLGARGGSDRVGGAGVPRVPGPGRGHRGAGAARAARAAGLGRPGHSGALPADRARGPNLSTGPRSGANSRSYGDDAHRDPGHAAGMVGRAADHGVGAGGEPEGFGDLVQQRLGLRVARLHDQLAEPGRVAQPQPAAQRAGRVQDDRQLVHGRHGRAVASAHAGSAAGHPVRCSETASSWSR